MMKYKVQIQQIINFSNQVRYLIQQWVTKCNDKKNIGEIQNFVKSTITSSPTGNSNATNLPRIGDSFMYLKTSGDYNGTGVFVTLQWTDIIEMNNITFSYNRFSAGSTRSKGCFRFQLVLADKIWSARYDIIKMIDVVFH